MATTIKYQGTEIKLTSKYQGVAYPWGEKYQKNHYRVFITINGEKVQFEYYTNAVSPLKKDELINAFYCFLSDGIAYINARDIDDFQSEFGYTKVSECTQVYNACKRAYEKWMNVGGIDIYDICNWLQDEYNL